MGKFEAFVEPPSTDPLDVLSRFTSHEQLERILRVKNKSLLTDVAEIASIANPSSIFVHTGSLQDRDYIKRKALDGREELPSRHSKHTVHFDGPNDLARDKANTRILVPYGEGIPLLNTLDRESGIEEIASLLKGSMKGREMFVAFYLYGPRNSRFSLYGVQVTDSAYVIHSEDILYRNCYTEFVERGEEIEYMLFLHSAGARDENGWSRDVDKRRIYIDLKGNAAYSVNTQYAGNAVGLKKLSLRLAVYKGFKEGWLAEHMFIVGVLGPGGRVSYMTGAFPAGCGKTATAMSADTVVGDDLAIIRNIGGVARAVNPEVGMFGIIDGLNPVDDAEIYRVLVNPEIEAIFSNVLLTEDGEVWWRGKESEPREGVNYAGRWKPGKTDGRGVLLLPSHPNARFTVSIYHLNKLDPAIDDPLGVPVSAFVFGGRDSTTLPLVQEAFDWFHGISTMGAALESESTAAVLGRTGEIEFNPFAILDFLSISPGALVDLHFKFGEKLDKVPRVFSVNYFLRGEDGRYFSEKRDKRVWLKWMELRVHGDVNALKAPTGLLPLYDDLQMLFDKELGKSFNEGLYCEMFKLKVPKLMSKIERIYEIYSGIRDTPPLFFEILRLQLEKLKEARSRYGDIIEPFKLDKG
ncbi:MAG: phosphoenolpyruvate carboxykinase (GTP) [Thermofilaceae archaeon]|nr:phosphoenolpyruvate carboxykinase (GTP) [Thermofilaceae archaeon]